MFDSYTQQMKEIQTIYDLYYSLPIKYKHSLFNNNTTEGIYEEITADTSIENVRNKYLSISTKDKMIRDINTFIFENPPQIEKNERIENKEELKKFIIETLKKYQWLVGGYNIEDFDWYVEEGYSTRFKIKKTDIILYNTVNDLDDETRLFIKKLKKYIKNYTNEKKLKFNISINNDDLLDLYFITIHIKNIIEP